MVQGRELAEVLPEASDGGIAGAAAQRLGVVGSTKYAAQQVQKEGSLGTLGTIEAGKSGTLSWSAPIDLVVINPAPVDTFYSRGMWASGTSNLAHLLVNYKY